MTGPKFRVLPTGHDVDTETTIEMPEGKMFGGGALIGTGTNQVEAHVATGPTTGGPWTEIFCVHAQYSGTIKLQPFPCDKYIRITPSGTGATFDGYMCWE